MYSAASSDAPHTTEAAAATGRFVHHRIKATYIAALLAIALLGLIFFITLLNAASSQQTTVDAIRLNTEQRMQLQRITLIFSLLTSEQNTAERNRLYEEIDQRIDLLEGTHAAFIGTDTARHLPAEVYHLYFDGLTSLEHQLEAFISVVQRLSEQPAFSSQSQDFQQLLELAPRLREQYNAIISIYDQMNQGEVNNLRTLAYVLFSALLCLLVVEGFLIFRPMELAVRHAALALLNEIAQRQQVEIALRRSEAAYRLLTQHLPDMAVMLFDRDLRFTLAEGPALNDIGFRREAVEGKTLKDVVSASAYEQLIVHYQAALAGQRTVLERPFNGHHYYTHFTPVYDDANVIVGGMVTSQDITQRKQAEEALQESETRFRVISQLMSDYAYAIEVSPEGNLTTNWKAGAFAQITGYTSEEFDQQGGWRSVFYPEDLPVAALRFKQLMAGQDDISEFRIVTKSGEVRWLRDYGHPILDEQQQRVTWIYGAAKDITLGKQAEEALKRSEERFRTITENANDLIALLDAKLHCMYANPGYQSILNYDPANLIGRAMIEFIHPDDREKIEHQGELSTSTRQPTGTLEFRHAHADGHYVWVEGSISFLYSPQGNFQGAVVVLHDRTERRRLVVLELEQERLKTSLEKERELNHLKSAMMLRIAHEFRTPLAIILTSTEMLNRYYERLSPEQRLSKGKIVEQQIDHIIRMLDDIGLVVQGSFKPHSLSFTSINLSQLCQTVQAEFEAEYQQPHRFVVDVARDMNIRGDYSSLHRALYEIFSNAIRFSTKGDIVIRLTTETGVIKLSVMDRGIGIPIEEQSRVIEPFFRGTNINEVGGLGLGLTIAKEVIDAHHGSLDIESGINTGTTVTITLPA